LTDEEIAQDSFAQGGKVWRIPIRLSVLINKETQDALKMLAEHRKWSTAQTVDYAIKLSKFLMDEEKAGREIHITNKKGKRPKQLILD